MVLSHLLTLSLLSSVTPLLLGGLFPKEYLTRIQPEIADINFHDEFDKGQISQKTMDSEGLLAIGRCLERNSSGDDLVSTATPDSESSSGVYRITPDQMYHNGNTTDAEDGQPLLANWSHFIN